MGKGKKKKAAEVIKKVEAEGKKEDAAAKKAEGGSEGAKKKEKKKADEGKKEEDVAVGGGKTAEGGGGEAEGEKKEKTPPPPPPEEIVMRVWMHCEGCARKVQRSLAGFPGVEDVKADSRTQMVVVKGKPAAADPLKVVERLQRKSGRKVELLSPIPPKPEKEEEKKEEDPAEKPKSEEEKKEEPSVTEVVLKVRMHCDACAQEIKRRILKMKGVRSADMDLKTSQVTVKGVFDPMALVEHVHRRTWRHATVVKVKFLTEKAPDKDKSGQDKVAGGDGKNDKIAGGGGGDKVENTKKGKGGDDRVVENDGDAAWKDAVVMKNSYNYYHPRYQVEYTYPPQIFSDENPNACSVM